jgi:hypothetical protein
MLINHLYWETRQQYFEFVIAAVVCIAVVITVDVAAFSLLLSQALLWVWHATGTITLHLTH